MSKEKVSLSTLNVQLKVNVKFNTLEYAHKKHGKGTFLEIVNSKKL